MGTVDHFFDRQGHSGIPEQGTGSAVPLFFFTCKAEKTEMIAVFLHRRLSGENDFLPYFL